MSWFAYLRFEGQSYEVIPITQDQVVGRRPECTIQIRASVIEGRHFRVSLKGDEITVSDVSTTGLWLSREGAAVERVRKARVSPGDRVTVPGAEGFMAFEREDPRVFWRGQPVGPSGLYVNATGRESFIPMGALLRFDSLQHQVDGAFFEDEALARLSENARRVIALAASRPLQAVELARSLELEQEFASAPRWVGRLAPAITYLAGVLSASARFTFTWPSRAVAGGVVPMTSPFIADVSALAASVEEVEVVDVPALCGSARAVTRAMFGTKHPAPRPRYDYRGRVHTVGSLFPSLVTLTLTQALGYDLRETLSLRTLHIGAAAKVTGLKSCGADHVTVSAPLLPALRAQLQGAPAIKTLVLKPSAFDGAARRVDDLLCSTVERLVTGGEVAGVVPDHVEWIRNP